MSTSSSTAERRALLSIVTLAVTASLAAHAVFAVWPELFQAWDRKVSDRLFVLRSAVGCLPTPCRHRVVHVDLTYSTLRRMSRRRATRADHARVLRTLTDARSSAQVFDFVFPAPEDPAEDQSLADAAAASGRAYFGLVFHTERPRDEAGVSPDPDLDALLAAAAWDVRVEGSVEALPEGFDPLGAYPELAQGARGFGFLNLTADGDGVFRRTPLLMRHNGRVYPSLALRVACDVLGVAPREVVVTPARSIRLLGARRPGASAARDVTIPLDAAGTYRVDFAGPWNAYRHANYRAAWRAASDPVEMELIERAVADRVALVADISTGAGDGGPVPTDARFPLAGVHATVIQNILDGSFVREARHAEAVALELLLLVVVIAIGSRLGSRTIGAACLLLGFFYTAIAVGAFLYLRVIVDVVRPLLATGVAAFAIVAYRFLQEEKARATLRSSFEAYFPPAVVDRIVRNPELLLASGQKKELTILFSDIVAFTTRSETMSPDETRLFLNEHFAAMVEIVFEYGGTVDKFIGDGLMVFFGDPEDQPDHAVRAVRAAMAMQRKTRELSARAPQPYEMRIGIHTGIVTVGNMGAPRRLSYTVLGAAVNLAQRLESNAPPGGILISARTQALLQGSVDCVARGEIRLKGLQQPVAVFAVPVNSSALSTAPTVVDH